MPKLRFKRYRSGFTLIEMTVVLFIISLLILIILPNIAHQRHNAQNVHRNAMTSVVQSQIDSYLNDNDNSSTVNYGELEHGKYLTSAQVKKAKSEHIQIDHGNQAAINK